MGSLITSGGRGTRLTTCEAYAQIGGNFEILGPLSESVEKFHALNRDGSIKTVYGRVDVTEILSLEGGSWVRYRRS